MEMPLEVCDRNVAADRSRPGQVSEAQIDILPTDALPIAQKSADGAVVISNVDIAKPDTDTGYRRDIALPNPAPRANIYSNEPALIARGI